MDPITLGLLAAAATAFAFSTKEKEEKISLTPHEEDIKFQVLERLKDASKITVPPIESWHKMTIGNDEWLVSPTYIAPVGIGEAMKIAKTQGLELPTPEMVDAIWKAADLKIEPNPRGQFSKPPSDFTTKTMNSNETNIAQLAFIRNQIADKEFKLLAGSHKDIVMKDGKVGIYGWHKLTGKPIQDFFTGHSHSDNPAFDWKDYSQGLRLVKKVTQIA